MCLALSLVPSTAAAQVPAPPESKVLSDALTDAQTLGGTPVHCRAGGVHVVLADVCLHFPNLRPSQLILELSVSRADRLVLKQWAASDRNPGTLLNIWSLGTEHRAVWVVPAASGQGSVLAFWPPTLSELL
jgi:hypothetical protein